MGQRVWHNVIVFPFHEIYPIFFVNKFSFVRLSITFLFCSFHLKFYFFFIWYLLYWYIKIDILIHRFLYVKKSFKVYHPWQKKFNPYYNCFCLYLLEKRHLAIMAFTIVFNNIMELFSIIIATLYQIVDFSPTLVGDIDNLPINLSMVEIEFKWSIVG